MNQTIDNLLIEFDEMGFAPTNVCDDPEGKAKLWKSALVYEIGLLLDEHAAIRKKAVEEFAEKLKIRMVDSEYYGVHFKKGCYSEKTIDDMVKEFE